MNNKSIGIVVLVAAILVAGFVVFLNKKPAANAPGNTQTAVNTQPAASAVCQPEAKGIIALGKNATLTNYLTDAKCMTLYVSSADKAGVSNCDAKCTETWKPFAYDQTDLKTLTSDLAKTLNIIKRKDGTYQYAYGNTPLYYYSGDVKAGDAKGNGLASGQWSVVLVDQQATKK